MEDPSGDPPGGVRVLKGGEGAGGEEDGEESRAHGGVLEIRHGESRRCLAFISIYLSIYLLKTLKISSFFFWLNN